jgi:hypothetical protein
MRIPTFKEADYAIHEKREFTPLDIFIYQNEPAGEDDERIFRSGLENLIKYVKEQP